MSRLELALDQIRAARQHSLRMLSDVPDGEWWRLPPGCPSHIAWQVGHLAIAEYRLGLWQVRGTRDSDAQLLPADFAQRFGRESVPAPATADSPTPDELRQYLTRVHEAVLAEASQLTAADLDGPSQMTHVYFNDRLGGLFWCARHEMLHAGQIGLIRRQLGHAALW